MNLHGILNKGHGRRRVERQVAMLAAIGVAMLGGIAAVATTAQADPLPKVWVCKYVGTPGPDERLQIASADNQNPHSVDANSTDGTGVGGYFKDAQGQSYVLALNPNNDNEYTGAASCPAPRLNIVTVTSEDATSCTAYRVRDVTTTIGWVEEGGRWVKGAPVITYGEWVISDPTAGQLAAADLVCPNIPLIEVTPKASATLGSCDAAGHVDLVAKTGISWSGNTGSANAPTYTAKANAGYKLIGTGVFTFHGLSQLPSTSPACLVTPAPVVAGVVENAPVVAGVVENAPVVKGVVKNAPAVKSLAFTGAETLPLGLSGLLALVLGAVLTVASRRQRPKQARE